MVSDYHKPSALLQNNTSTNEPLVTPDQMDKDKRQNATSLRRAFKGTKKRPTAVATEAADNGVSALTAELQDNRHSPVRPGTTPMMELASTTDEAPVAPQAPKRRRKATATKTAVVSPTVAVTTGPPKKKCQGCVHGDLLEMNVMEPAHIKHYIKSAEFLELAKCAGDCTHTIRAIHEASPKENIYYCDTTNKGFYAPDDDLTKAGMECGLILCSPCHAVREARYALAQATEGTGNRRESCRAR